MKLEDIKSKLDMLDSLEKELRKIFNYYINSKTKILTVYKFSRMIKIAPHQFSNYRNKKLDFTFEKIERLLNLLLDKVEKHKIDKIFKEYTSYEYINNKLKEVTFYQRQIDIIFRELIITKEITNYKLSKLIKMRPFEMTYFKQNKLIMSNLRKRKLLKQALKVIPIYKINDIYRNIVLKNNCERIVEIEENKNIEEKKE